MDDLHNIEQTAYQNLINAVKQKMEKGFLLDPRLVKKAIKNCNNRLSRLECYGAIFIASKEELNDLGKSAVQIRGQIKAYNELLDEYSKRLKEANK